jgi:hypothetical protein
MMAVFTVVSQQQNNGILLKRTDNLLFEVGLP